MGPTPDASVDAVNEATWARFADEFAIEGWSDPGELATFLLIADQVRGAPILDIGVGGGRTYPLLRLLSSDYLAVDYSPQMVELCRRRHPDADVRLDDARELRTIDDGSRGLVAYSSNGIDAVDHDDRQRVLQAVHRVLSPGGIFFFSTLNKDGPLFDARPGSAPDTPWLPGSLLPRPEPVAGGDAAGAAAAAAQDEDPRWVRAVRNWRRLRSMTVDAGDWGLSPFAPHDYGLVTHFITVPGAVRELDEHGFDTNAVVTCDGSAPLAEGQTTTAMYVHVVARRRP